MKVVPHAEQGVPVQTVMPGVEGQVMEPPPPAVGGKAFGHWADDGIAARIKSAIAANNLMVFVSLEWPSVDVFGG